MIEKRNFTRVEFSECASIKHDNQVFFGDIKDVSLQGLFVKTEQDIPLHAPVEVTLYHSPESSIYLQADVVRRESAGVGLRINRMDVNSFIHLRNVITLKCNDYDLIMRETYKMSSCIQ